MTSQSQTRFATHCGDQRAKTLAMAHKWLGGITSWPQRQAHQSREIHQWVAYIWHWRRMGIFVAWWRHQMEAFSALRAICVGNSPVNGEFPSQRPVTRSFDVFFDLRLNKRLSKQSWGWWFETLSRQLWRHCNEKRCSFNTHLRAQFPHIFLQPCHSDTIDR